MSSSSLTTISTWAWHVTPERLSTTKAGDLSIDGRITITCRGIEPFERLEALEELGREIVRLAHEAQEALLDGDVA